MPMDEGVSQSFVDTESDILGLRFGETQMESFVFHVSANAPELTQGAGDAQFRIFHGYRFRPEELTNWACPYERFTSVNLI